MGSFTQSTQRVLVQINLFPLQQQSLQYVSKHLTAPLPFGMDDCTAAAAANMSHKAVFRSVLG